jgi:uncharacterized membrane protein
MNKNEFLNKLKAALAVLPEEDIQKTVDYYSEIIDDAVEEGESEQDITERLGDVNEIADKIINETPVQKLKRKYGLTAAILITAGSPIWIAIAAALLAIAAALYISVWAVIASLFAVFAAAALGGAAMLVVSVPLLFVRPLDAMLSFGTALVCAGLSVFMFYLSVWIAELVVRFTCWIFSKIRRRKK